MRSKSHLLIKIVSVGVLFFATLRAQAAEPVQVGSKAFTESVILGEMAAQLGNDAGVRTVHRSQLGGARGSSGTHYSAAKLMPIQNIPGRLCKS